MAELVWIIPLCAFLAYLLTLLVGPSLRENASYIGIVLIGAAFVAAVATLIDVIGGAAGHLRFAWLTVGETQVDLGVQVGPLEASVLVMVTLVSLMVEVYSRGYMRGDARYNRFYTNVNLFVFGMLGLVISDNFLMFVAFWEIMGLCSYLLIGHWFEDLENAKAALKAFLTTRVGDAAFFIGIWLYYQSTGTFAFGADLSQVAQGTLVLMGIMMFLGAMGKSAQMPLHIWLPDAMAGPTPVSALIHAATMVAAGVFLVARAYPIFVEAPVVLLVVAIVGGVTALAAALIATVQVDIKKTLAYSTISQLGYMMLSLGVGGFVPAVFHLLTHGFFKGLLFLGSGSVIHSAGTQDMHEMGGLYRKMPVTAITFMVGSLALAGIPPFAGYFSKDEILLTAFHSAYPWLFWLGIAAAFLTAYYMTRLIVLTFFGKPRVPHLFEHAHESPAVMTVPLIVLAVPAALAGFAGAPQLGSWFSHFVQAPVAVAEAAPSGLVTALAVGVALAGILVGWTVYATRAVDRALAIRYLYPLYVFLKQKMYFDHLAGGVALFGLGVANVVAAFDHWVIDGIINGVAWLTGALGNVTRRWAMGSGQAYAMTLFAAVVVGLILYQVLGG